MLVAFAELVIASGTKNVIDVGCGTGAATRVLHDNGLDVRGIDLSPGMLEQARRLNPDLSFSVGSMTKLDTPDASVGGVCAWYSIIHIPAAHLDAVFDEFARVLIPGGLALLAFQVGDQPRILREAFGQPVDLTFFRLQPDAITRRLERAGLRRFSVLVREPADDGFETTPHAYLIARK